MEIMELTALKDRKVIHFFYTYSSNSSKDHRLTNFHFHQAVKEILEPMALKGLRDPPETQV